VRPRTAPWAGPADGRARRAGAQGLRHVASTQVWGRLQSSCTSQPPTVLAQLLYIFPIPAVCRRSTLSRKSWRRCAREEHHDAPAGDSVVGSATPSEWSRSAVPSVLNPTWPPTERLLRRARARLSAPRLPADAPSALVAHQDRDVLPLGPAWPGCSPMGLL